MLNCYVHDWLDEGDYNEFVYDSDGHRLLYRNHREYYKFFRTIKDKAQDRLQLINTWLDPEDQFFEPFNPISLADQALKVYVISEYIRLNQLFRKRSRPFCCLRWNVHVFVPFDFSTIPILSTKFKWEILRLNKYYRNKCTLCWRNDPCHNNKRNHRDLDQEVQYLYNSNYRMEDEAKLIYNPNALLTKHVIKKRRYSN